MGGGPSEEWSGISQKEWIMIMDYRDREIVLVGCVFVEGRKEVVGVSGCGCGCV